MAVCLLFSILFYSISLQCTSAEDQCSLPSNEELTTLLNSSLIDHLDINSTEITNLTISNTSYTCLAAGTLLQYYRFFSVVIEYMISSTSMLEYVHMDGKCSSDEWKVDDGDVIDAAKENLNIPLSEKCAACTAFNTNHCFPGCHSSCDVYSGKCTAHGSDDCCPVFDNGVCANSCPINFAPDAENFYQCACNISCPPGYEPSLLCDECNYTNICLAETPCMNGGKCVLDYPPDEYHCDCVDYFNGTNCTECTLECALGYNNTNCNCEVTDICLALSPCANGGNCTSSESFPANQFTCDCINEYDAKSNCTECLLSCENGFVPDANCDHCILSNICLASNSPCINGGTCILVSPPDQFICNCPNHYDPYSNCSNCSLKCGRGYSPDASCSFCELSNICEALSPCLNEGTCILNESPINFTCDCVNHFDPKLNCSVCSLQCVTGYTPDVNCTHCYLTDICEANEPCQNGGNCTLTAGLPDQYQCDCHENITGYTGINCTVCNVTCPDGYASDVMDTDMCTCQVTDICEAEKPCQNGGTCVLAANDTVDSFPNRTYECTCADSYTNINCTERINEDDPATSPWWWAMITIVCILSILGVSVCLLLSSNYLHNRRPSKVVPL